MTATKFMAIYSIPKKMLRRKVIFAFRSYGAVFMEWDKTDEDYLDPAWLLPGEGMVLVDVDYYWQGHEVLHAAIDMAIYKKHGVYAILPGDLAGRCAVVDPITGLVDKIIMADDEVDIIKDRILKNDPFASRGDIYDFKTGSFRKPLGLFYNRRFLLSTSKLAA